MTLWEIFGPLFGRLTGRSVAVRSPTQEEWARRLGPLGLSADSLPCQVVGGKLLPVCEYRHFRKRKKGGGYREISEPAPQLKRVQKAILTQFLSSASPHPAAVAYRRGHSTADHVWTHAGAEILVTVDLADFFPSTREDRIEGWWHRQVGDLALVQLLTALTTYHGALPQGAPTSPALSNLVNFEMDERLTRRAVLVGARYTRYCDDLAFSWPRGAEPPSDFHNAVLGTVLEFGYRSHPTKGWKIYERCDEPEVTGVILTRKGRIRLPDRLQQVMARLAASDDPHDGQRLAGYRAYAKMMTRRKKPVVVPTRPVDVPLPTQMSTSQPVRDDVDFDEDDEEIPF